MQAMAPSSMSAICRCGSRPARPSSTPSRHISFTVAKGEIVALVGESGSGKTVSALSILRLLPYPSASHPTGAIHFGGKDLLKAPGHTMRELRGEKISIIFQEPMTSLNPLHTIEKQVGEIMKLHHGLDDATARARVLELLRKVGLDNPERRLHAYPHQLSGGQRQRVMIAMALANEPDLLIADEPTTALDVTIQAQILELLKSPAARARHGHAADHARPGRGAPHGRPRLRHEQGRDRRAGAHGRRVRAAAAPLHAPSDVGRAQGRPAAGRAERAGGARDARTSRSGSRSSAGCCAAPSTTSRPSTACP